MDIADAIEMDLVEIHALLERAEEAASTADESTAARCLEELIWALEAHAQAERRTLYEPCIEAGGDLRAYVERSHRRLDAAARELNTLRGRHDPRGREVFATARSLVRHHARDEEAVLLDELRRRVPEFERAAMAVAFIIVRDRILAELRGRPSGNFADPAPLPSGPGFNDGEVLR